LAATSTAHNLVVASCPFPYLTSLLPTTTIYLCEVLRDGRVIQENALDITTGFRTSETMSVIKKKERKKSRHKKILKRNKIQSKLMAPLFYVQTVIDATTGFFLFLSYTIRIFLFGGGLILLTVGVHPETYVTAFGSGSGSGSQCVRQSGIKRQWRAPDLCNCTRGPRSFRILNSIILHTHHHHGTTLGRQEETSLPLNRLSR
jgi:hypothetical protein